MRLIAASFLLVGAAALAGLAAPAVSKKGSAATAKSANKRGAVAGKAAAAGGKRAVGKRIVRRRLVDQRPTYVGQQRPAPERIQEIERALVEKGYLTGEPDVNWDQATTDALRRFQQSQNLNADGRLSSMSLIALGLGARQNRVAGAPDAVVPAPLDPPVVRPGSGTPAPSASVVAPVPVPPPPPPASSAPLPLPVSLPTRRAPLPAPPLPVTAAAAALIARPAAVVVTPVTLPAAPGVAVPPVAAPVLAPPPKKNMPLIVPDTSVPPDAAPPQAASN